METGRITIESDKSIGQTLKHLFGAVYIFWSVSQSVFESNFDSGSSGRSHTFCPVSWKFTGQQWCRGSSSSSCSSDSGIQSPPAYPPHCILCTGGTGLFQQFSATQRSVLARTVVMINTRPSVCLSIWFCLTWSADSNCRLQLQTTTTTAQLLHNTTQHKVCLLAQATPAD